MDCRSNHVSIGLCLALAALVSGCYASHRRPREHSDAAIEADAGDEPLDQAVPSLAEALCARTEQCAGPVAVAFTGDTCLAYTEAGLTDAMAPLWKQAVANGSLTLHPERFADCIVAIADLPCADLALALPVACDAFFEGSLPPGASCTTTEQCAGDSHCVSGTSCPGVCQVRPGLGERCGIGGCSAGLTCAASGSCVPLSASDVPCLGPGGGGCGNSLMTCVGDTATTSGTCQPWVEAFALPAGALCDPVLEDFCRLPSVCALVSGTRNAGEGVWRCEGPYDAGGPCLGAFPDGCPPGQFCAIDPSDEPRGVCHPLPGAGMTCAHSEFVLWRGCQADLACDGVTCRRRARIGERCTGDIVCSTLRCRDDVCQARECIGPT